MLRRTSSPQQRWVWAAEIREHFEHWVKLHREQIKKALCVCVLEVGEVFGAMQTIHSVTTGRDASFCLRDSDITPIRKVLMPCCVA